MIEMVDSNKNGTVDFPEFLKMMTTMMEAAQTPGDPDEDISQAFKVFDKVKKVCYCIERRKNQRLYNFGSGRRWFNNRCRDQGDHAGALGELERGRGGRHGQVSCHWSSAGHNTRL